MEDGLWTSIGSVFQEDLAVEGKTFEGKKITLKGIITKTDLSGPKAARLHMKGGIECNFGQGACGVEGLRRVCGGGVQNRQVIFVELVPALFGGALRAEKWRRGRIGVQ